MISWKRSQNVLFFHLISNSWVKSILMLSHVLSHVTILKESERLLKQKIQIPNWKLDVYCVRCRGFVFGFCFVLFFFLFLFFFGLFFNSDIKCISDCLTIKRKTIIKIVVVFFFSERVTSCFFNPQLRIHYIHNAYLIALDNCYYVKIKLILILE